MIGRPVLWPPCFLFWPSSASWYRHRGSTIPSYFGRCSPPTIVLFTSCHSEGAFPLFLLLRNLPDRLSLRDDAFPSKQSYAKPGLVCFVSLASLAMTIHWFLSAREVQSGPMPFSRRACFTIQIPPCIPIPSYPGLRFITGHWRKWPRKHKNV